MLPKIRIDRNKISGWSATFRRDVDENGTLFEFHTIDEYNKFKSNNSFATSMKGHKQVWYHGANEHNAWSIVEVFEFPKGLFEI